MGSITIQSVTFEVTEPYAEGHTLSSAEARALNQVRCENLANNMRKRVKEVIGDERLSQDSFDLTPEEHDALQKEISAYDERYDFSMTRIRGTADPVMTEARAIARRMILAQLKSQGRTLAEYKAAKGGYDPADKNPEKEALDAGKAAYTQLVEDIASKGKVMETAKRNVAETEAAQSIMKPIK